MNHADRIGSRLADYFQLVHGSDLVVDVPLERRIERKEAIIHVDEGLVDVLQLLAHLDDEIHDWRFCLEKRTCKRSLVITE